MWRTLPSPWQGPVLALAAGLAYVFTYRLNELIDPWALYAQGINLVFLPAGIKHLAILLAGPWGALGCAIALVGLATEFWSGWPVEHIALYSAISTGATWVGIRLSMRVLGIAPDLSNLQFLHLPLMDLLTTALHGFTTNAFFIGSGMKSDNFVSNALAMMFGDFVGSFIVLASLWLALVLLRRQRALQTNRD